MKIPHRVRFALALLLIPIAGGRAETGSRNSTPTTTPTSLPSPLTPIVTPSVKPPPAFTKDRARDLFQKGKDLQERGMFDYAIDQYQLSLGIEANPKLSSAWGVLSGRRPTFACRHPFRRPPQGSPR